MYYKSYSDLSKDINKNIHKLHELQIDLVVGIPRSGMIPSYMIALALNAHCIDLHSFLRNETPKKGNTRKFKGKYTSAWDAKRILLVDDSISSGKSMMDAYKNIPDELKNKIIKLAIYAEDTKQNNVDLYFEKIPQPRVFEWNIYHHNILSISGIDIDGVLCIDPTPEENDDGEKYKEFLLNAQPLFLPTGKIHTLVTNRLEKYRKETEIWLKKHEVIYENLIMLNLQSKEERQKQKSNFLHKARNYKNPNLSLFIESELQQALGIVKITGKPVYCTETNKLYTSSSLTLAYKSPMTFKKILRQNIIKLISPAIPQKNQTAFKKNNRFECVAHNPGRVTKNNEEYII